VYNRGAERIDRKGRARWKRRRFSQGQHRHFQANRDSVRFGHKTGSVTEELALVSPSKLAIDKVSKSFRSRAGTVLALDRVSLNVAEAEFLCIVGASGCGKSTLLNIIAGLEKPDSGTVLADGKTVTDKGSERMVMSQVTASFHLLEF